MPAQSQQKRRSATQDPDKPAKRTRVSRACDQCRVAREKCDGGQPTCSTCLTSKRGCTYTTNPKKRGIQPGYIRVLELALASLFQHNPETEKYLNDRLSKEGLSSLLLSRDSKESNKLHKQWRKTRFNRDVDTLPSGENHQGMIPIRPRPKETRTTRTSRSPHRLPPSLMIVSIRCHLTTWSPQDLRSSRHRHCQHTQCSLREILR